MENNLSGFDKLKAKLLETIKNRNFSLIHIGLEASSMYGYRLTEYFKNISLPAEIKAYMINAKYIYRFKKAYKVPLSSDQIHRKREEAFYSRLFFKVSWLGAGKTNKDPK